MKPPLTEKQIAHIEAMADTRFNGEFWGCVNMRWVVKKLVGHIRWMETRNRGNGEKEK